LSFYGVGMPNHAWQLAQLNIGVTVAPLESDQLAGFVNALEPINAIADSAPGFVWRLQDEDGDATSYRAFGDDSILVNMSVWESVEALGDFVFRSDHVQIMRQRRKWFVKLDEVFTVLWWVPAGHRPSIEEAEERLIALRHNGSTPYAFSFREPFPAPDSPGAAVQSPDDWLCPA
jgi:Domain of unknown function (DUF3291)